MSRYRSGAAAAGRWQTYVLASWGLLTLTALILLLRNWGYDDPYITFRYASNLLAGNGLVYNVGERVLSTTAPFYAVILSALGLIWSDLPMAGNLLSAAALVSASGLLLALAWSHGEKGVGVIAALLFTVSPFALRTFGAETCFYVMLILGGLYAYDRDRPYVAAVALALAAMVRPDGVLAAVSLGIYHLVRRRPVPWRPVFLYAALVGVWAGGLWLYFGTPVPVTLLAKQQQGQMAISTRFAPGLLEIVRGRLQQPSYWLPLACMVAGLFRVWKRARYWVPLLAWAGLYFGAYSMLGVSRYFWYYVPLVPATVVLVAEGATAVLDWLEGKLMPRPAPPAAPRVFLAVVSGLLVLALLAPSLWGLPSIASNPDPRLEVYRQIGQWLAANTPPLATVGALEVGIIGYYARRPMIDFAGLIQPEVARHLTATATYEDSAVWAIQNYQPEYVVLPPDSLPRVVQDPSFRGAYRSVREFAGEGAPWLAVYARDGIP